LGCDSLPGRPDPADRYQRPSEIKDFAVLYATNCSGCHGETGQHGPATPLSDPLYVALAEPDYLRQVIGAGVEHTPMPKFAISAGGTLTDEQIEILANGLRKYWSVAADEALAEQAPALVASSAGSRETQGQGDVARFERGLRVYEQFCADCHGVNGRGGERAGSIVHPAYLGLVSDQGLRTTVIVGRSDLGMPNWKKVGRRSLSAGEVVDVVAWMGLQRAAPR
jgi:cytochrome c oxidase cbb3-type subunit 3/ubiquinol-cytochrome c reductase cytochrome c subunit